MIKEKLLNFFNYFYCINNCYIYHIIFLYIFFLRITYTYAEITISHFFTYLLSKYENLEKSKKEKNLFYYFTNIFNFNNRNSDKFLNTKLFVVVYLPICLKCVYTLFFDYIAYYIYMHFYFRKINNDFKKPYYSSVSYENPIYKVNENFSHKKGIKQDKTDKKKKLNCVYINDTSNISIYKYKKYKLRKKKSLIYKKRLEYYTKNKNAKKTLIHRIIYKKGRIKEVRCKNNHIKDNLLNRSKKYDVFNKKLYYNILKERINIFTKRKKRNLNDEKKVFFNILRKGNTIKIKNIKLGNLRNNKNNYSICSYNAIDDNITSETYNANHDNFSRKTNMKIFSNSFCFNDILKDNNNRKIENFSSSSEFNKKSNNVEKQDKKIKKGENYFFNYHNNLRKNNSILNNESSKICGNMYIYEKCFENNKNDLCKHAHFEYCKIIEKNNICDNNFLTNNLHSIDEIFKYKSNNDIIFDDLKDKENKNNTRLKNLFKSLIGNLSIEYLFEYSNELIESNFSIPDNKYYYYNKFKSFHNEKSSNSYNIRKMINNKINAEYYNLKLNILILSCIIIQIFNSFILILISNNIITKKEKIFFFCFLYSLLESVTDVISDNIFFLCGKFTNIYKKEITINSIYILQVISKMVLSVSTIFIYFIYHIFIFSFKQVNIMIINTFIKVLSIFILSIIFLKNKNNIFKSYYDKKFINFNHYNNKKGDISYSKLLNSTKNDPFKIIIDKDELNVSKNGESNCNYSINKKIIKHINKDRDNICSPKKAIYHENFVMNRFVNDNTEKKKSRYIQLIFLKLKYISHIFNLFNLFPKIKKNIFKEDNANYNYTLLTLQNVKYDEENKHAIKEKQNYLIKIPIIKNIRNLCEINKLKYYSDKDSSNIKNNNIIGEEMEYMNEKKKIIININNNKLYKNGYNIYKYNNKSNKKKIIINYPFKLLLNNLNFSNIFYICLLLIIPTFERIFLNYKIKNITIGLHLYCYLSLVNHITDLIGLYLYISYFNEESYSSSIFLSSIINILLMTLRFLFLHNGYNQIGLLFLETALKSLHKTFFYMPIFILVTKAYIKNIHNIMCSFYSSILDFSSFASCYFEYLIISYYNIEDSKNVCTLVFIFFLILHLLSLIVISKLKKT
ncbi:conserved Plasmodium membrane protein, unknown function [Plasmodium relictum]|uniref:Uncharacterized protein n=1 Tax=Plasmodium relictum TaxID=85471 RepID=A0A1J1H6S6_PLARL|nr:conserved Plasmodium membrane protein, unknown function [Plasmodium relictum]CRH00363.1 conserved Plasmodium membrane protein, unknown function [Plasmodium relictum]